MSHLCTGCRLSASSPDRVSEKGHLKMETWHTDAAHLVWCGKGLHIKMASITWAKLRQPTIFQKPDTVSQPQIRRVRKAYSAARIKTLWGSISFRCDLHNVWRSCGFSPAVQKGREGLFCRWSGVSGGWQTDGAVAESWKWRRLTAKQKIQTCDRISRTSTGHSLPIAHRPGSEIGRKDKKKTGYIIFPFTRD